LRLCCHVFFFYLVGADNYLPTFIFYTFCGGWWLSAPTFIVILPIRADDYLPLRLLFI